MIALIFFKTPFQWRIFTSNLPREIGSFEFFGGCLNSLQNHYFCCCFKNLLMIFMMEILLRALFCSSLPCQTSWCLIEYDWESRLLFIAWVWCVKFVLMNLNYSVRNVLTFWFNILMKWNQDKWECHNAESVACCLYLFIFF